MKLKWWNTNLCSPVEVHFISIARMWSVSQYTSLSATSTSYWASLPLSSSVHMVSDHWSPWSPDWEGGGWQRWPTPPPPTPPGTRYPSISLSSQGQPRLGSQVHLPLLSAQLGAFLPQLFARLNPHLFLVCLIVEKILALSCTVVPSFDRCCSIEDTLIPFNMWQPQMARHLPCIGGFPKYQFRIAAQCTVT